MSARASVFEAVQFGVEATAGTAVLPNRRALSMSIQPQWQIEVNPFRPSGNKFNTVVSKGRDWTQASVSGAPTYTEIIYPLSSVLTTATTAAAGTGTAYTFSPSSTDVDTPKTFTYEVGSNGYRAQRFSYGIWTSFGLQYTRQNVTMSGQIMGQRMGDDRVRYITPSGTVSGGTFTITVGANTTTGQTHSVAAATLQSALAGLASVGAGNVTVTASGGTLPTGTYMIVFADSVDLTTCTLNAGSLTGGGTYTMSRIAANATGLSLVPIVPEHVNVYMDPSSGTLGTTQLLRCFEASWNIENRYQAMWPLNRSLDSFAQHYETAPNARVSLKLMGDSQGMSILQNLRAGDTRFVRIQALGGTYDSGQNYELYIDTAVKFTEVNGPTDSDGLISVDLTGVAVDDATWGRAMRAFVRTSVATL